MAKSIMYHRVIRGSLVYFVADIGFSDLRHAACACSDLQADTRRNRNELQPQQRWPVVSLTAEDAAIFERVSENQRREYQRADRDDAELAALRIRFFGIVFNVKAGVRS